LNIREVIRQTAASVAAHKLRSFLTMFGIIWGITSVILLVGLGKGFSRDQKERLKTIGVDRAIVWGGCTSEQTGGYAAGRPVRLSIQDAYVIKSEAYLIKTVSPELRRSLAEVSRYNRRIASQTANHEGDIFLKTSSGVMLTAFAILAFVGVTAPACGLL
jgi:putative ABC transport system permease protein